MGTAKDLVIIGAGQLGREVAAGWRRAYPQASIVGETLTTRTHEELKVEGITPKVVGSSDEKFPFVLFSAPPRLGVDYPEAVKAATARVAPGGTFVFTSSGSVYGPDARFASEDTPVDKSSSRSANIAAAEESALSIPNSRVVRLSGLFSMHRGGHVYHLETGVLAFPADWLINMITYQDAAQAVLRALEGGPAVEAADRDGKRVYLAVTTEYISARMLVLAALKHPKFAHFSEPSYANLSDRPVKRYKNSWTRETLGWAPEWESVIEFLAHDAAHWKAPVAV